MSLNSPIVEDAALEWFGEQSRYARTLTPALCLRPSPLRSGSHGERVEDGEVVQSRFAQTLTRPLPRGEEKCEAIRRLDPAIPEVTEPHM